MNHYIKLRSLLHDHKKFKEFRARFDSYGVESRGCYLNWLLLNVVSSIRDEVSLYLQLLISHGANPNCLQEISFSQANSMRRSPLMVASQQSNKLTVECLLHYQAVDRQKVDAKGRNALFYAVLNQNDLNSCQILDILLVDLMKTINTCDDDNKSLLMYAIDRNSIKVFRKILQAGINPNIQLKKSGNTSIHEIIRSAKKTDIETAKAMIQILLEKGASPFILNKDHENALQFAKKHKKQLEEPIQQFIIIHNKENIRHNPTARVQLEEDSSEESEDEVNTSQELCGQIMKYWSECDDVHKRAWKDLQPIFYGPLLEISQTLNLQVSIIGSFATGLWTPASDINIMYTNTDAKSHVNIDGTLEKMQKLLKNKTKHLQIAKLYIKRSPKFPKLKVELPVNGKNRKLDISVFHKNTTSCKYVCFITEQLQKYPYIRPIFFFLQKLLVHFRMDSMQKGGIQNYLLFLMIWISAEEFKDEQIDDIGAIFSKVMENLAHRIQYQHKIENGQPLRLLNVMDPLNPMNCLGGWQINGDRLDQIMKTIYYGLKVCEGSPMNYLCSLSKIFN